MQPTRPRDTMPIPPLLLLVAILSVATLGLTQLAPTEIPEAYLAQVSAASGQPAPAISSQDAAVMNRHCYTGPGYDYTCDYHQKSKTPGATCWLNIKVGNGGTNPSNDTVRGACLGPGKAEAYAVKENGTWQYLPNAVNILGFDPTQSQYSEGEDVPSSFQRPNGVSVMTDPLIDRRILQFPGDQSPCVVFDDTTGECYGPGVIQPNLTTPVIPPDTLMDQYFSPEPLQQQTSYPVPNETPTVAPSYQSSASIEGGAENSILSSQVAVETTEAQPNPTPTANNPYVSETFTATPNSSGASSNFSITVANELQQLDVSLSSLLSFLTSKV